MSNVTDHSPLTETSAGNDAIDDILDRSTTSEENKEAAAAFYQAQFVAQGYAGRTVMGNYYRPDDGQNRTGTELHMDYIHDQIIAGARQANRQVRDRVALIFSNDKQSDLEGGDSDLTRELGFTNPLAITVIARDRGAIQAGYTEGAADIKACLDEIPAAVQSIETQLSELATFCEVQFGTAFEATLTDTQGAATVQPFNKTGLPLRPGHGHDLRGASSILSEKAGTELSSVAGRGSGAGPYLDIAEADRNKLKYPNYPLAIMSGSSVVSYNLAKEHFSGEEKATKMAGTTSGAEYPSGWAIVIASALSNAHRALEQLRASPSHDQHIAGTMPANYETLVSNAFALVDARGSGALSTEQQYTLSGSVTAPTGMVLKTDFSYSLPDYWPETSNAQAFGLQSDLRSLVNSNLPAAAAGFSEDGLPSAFKNEGARAITQFKEKMAAIRAQLHDYLICQLIAIAKDDILDKRVGELAAGRGYQHFEMNDPAALKEAHLRTRSVVVDAVIKEFRGRTITGDVEEIVIEPRRDKRYILFREQCFLLNYMDVFLRQKLKEDIVDKKKALPYARPSGYAPSALPGVASSATNASLLLSGDPYGFMNRLTLNPRLGELVNISNEDLSLLQPCIRLFKVVYDEYGNDDYQIEMKFPTHMTKNELTQFGSDAGARGVGVGIKNFVFSYEGSNPFAIKKSIKANLKIYASNFRELLQPRPGRSTKLEDSAALASRNYRYVDLALKTGRAHHVTRPAPGDCGKVDLAEQNENLADLNFRLRAEVGWAPIEGTEAHVSTKLQKAVQASFVTLNLTPTVHSFDLDEKGQVVMNINYLAYIEEFFDNKNFNIFANAQSPRKSAEGRLVTVENILRSWGLEEVSRNCKDPNVAAEVKEDYKKLVAKDQQVAMQNLISKLAQRNEIRYLNMPYEDLKNYLLSNDPQSLARVTSLVNNASAMTEADLSTSLSRALTEFKRQKSAEPGGQEGTETNEDAIAAALLAGEEKGAVVSYFYLGRLIDVILEQIDIELDKLGNTAYLVSDSKLGELRLPSTERIVITKGTRKKKKREFEIAYDNFKRLRILLGPVEFANSPTTRKLVVTNATFGDIPVSVKYFMEFLTEKMLKKEETFYSLTKFLNDVMNEFVRDFLNNRDCFRNMKTKVRAQQASLTSWSPDTKHDVLALKTAQTGLTHSLITKDSNGKIVVDEDMISSTRIWRTHIDDITSALPDHPILYLSGPPGARTQIPPDQEFNYFVYFAGQVQPLDKMKGIRSEDEERGIFHYLLGREKGLIKNISLKKTQTKGLAEVRFEQDGYDGLRQLRVVYDVEIDSFANINTYPGTYIYVDPAGFDPGYNLDTLKLTELGIGGYYMIIRSEHDFGPGKSNSRIVAKWVNQVEADAANDECMSLREQGNGPADRNADVCGKYTAEREEASEESSPGNIFVRAGKGTLKFLGSAKKKIASWF